MAAEKPVTREEARAAGAKLYFTGKPCKRGHVEARYTSTCVCVGCWRRNLPLRKQYAPSPKNPFTPQQRARINHAKRAAYAHDPEKTLRRVKKYHLENPEKLNARSNKRRARRKNAVPLWYGELDELVSAEATRLAKLRGALTGVMWQVDHMLALGAVDVCGLHVGVNLQVIPRSLNLWKANRPALRVVGEWVKVV